MKKFEYYKALRNAGIAEVHAISMVQQANNREEQPSAAAYISQFAVWGGTKEGYEFWKYLWKLFSEIEANQ